MRYRRRALLILLAIMPPLLAVSWHEYSAWREDQARRAAAVEARRAAQAKKYPLDWYTMAR